MLESYIHKGSQAFLIFVAIRHFIGYPVWAGHDIDEGMLFLALITVYEQHQHPQTPSSRNFAL